MWDLSSLTRDLTQIPLQWDYAVLTTGAPGKAGGPINKNKKKKKQKKKNKRKKRDFQRITLEKSTKETKKQWGVRGGRDRKK